MRHLYDTKKEKKKNEIRNSKKDRVSTYMLAADFDLAQSTVHSIVTRKIWIEKEMEKNVTKRFSYVP